MDRPRTQDTQTAGMGRKTRKPPVVAAGGGSGDFVGPASAANNAIVRFDGTTGKLGQGSVVTLGDTGAVANVSRITFDDSTVYDSTIINAAAGFEILTNSDNFAVSSIADAIIGAGTSATVRLKYGTGGGISLGSGLLPTVVLTFDSSSSDGLLTWSGDDDYFQFGDTVIFDRAIQVQGATYLNGLVAYIAIITPAQITASQNDYAPTGHATSSVMRLDASAAWSITGIAGGAIGRKLQLHNIGVGDITLTDEDAASTAANRFALNANITLLPDQSIELWYDGAGGSSRWRVLGGVGGGSGDVVGPASSTDNYLASYSGATGKLIKETALKATISGSTISLLFDTLVTDGTLQWLGSGDGFQFLDDVLMASDEFLAFRTSAQKIWSSATATLDIDSTAGTINIGHDGHCDFGGSGTAYAMRPQTDNNADLGDSTHEWRDVFVDGTVQTDALRIDEGGSTTIGAGVGSVKMTSATAATNTAWIPINYAGTVYYVPAWTTNSP